MKAISIKQPWAWAILHAGKDIENRKRIWHHKGEFAIHASGKPDTFDHWPADIPKPKEDALQLSAFVGVVDLMGMVEQSNSRWWRGGPIGWILANPRPLPRPIPYSKGKSAIWNVPPGITDLIRRQLTDLPTGDQTMAIVSRLLIVTQGNLDNDYLNLSEVLDMFPQEACGGSDVSQVASRPVRVLWGNETVETDIDGTKKIFRKRGWVRRFFDENRIQAGDQVFLEQIEPYLYRVSRG